LGLKLPLGKESFGFASIKRMFLPRKDFNKIMNRETKAKEEVRLKKTHHVKIPGGKRKKLILRKKKLSL